METLKLHADGEPAMKALAELSLLLEADAEVPRELADLAFECLDSPAQLVRLEAKPLLAPPADEILIVMEPSDRSLDLLAALQARKRDIPVS